MGSSTNNHTQAHHRKEPSSSQMMVVISLEKSKKKIFGLIEQLSRMKQQIMYNQLIQDGQKSALKLSIDALVNDLSNEIVNISEDVSKARAGSGGNVDSKKTKRKIRKLENEANGILTKVNELELISDQKRQETSNTRVNNFLEETSSKTWHN